MCAECFMYIKPAKQLYKVNVITVSSITVKKIETQKEIKKPKLTVHKWQSQSLTCFQDSEGISFM